MVTLGKYFASRRRLRPRREAAVKKVEAHIPEAPEEVPEQRRPGVVEVVVVACLDARVEDDGEPHLAGHPDEPMDE